MESKDYKYLDELPPDKLKPGIEFVDVEKWMSPTGEIIRDAFDKEHRTILKVYFQSYENIYLIRTKFAGYNLSVKAYFCNRPIVNWLSVKPELYWNGVDLTTVEKNPISDRYVGKPIMYYVLLNAYSKQGWPDEKKFDLRKNADDVCVRVIGRAYLGLQYKSNELVIPKNMIMQALNSMKIKGSEKSRTKGSEHLKIDKRIE